MIPLELKFDHDGILYLDKKIDEKDSITFENSNKSRYYRFYHIPSTQEYIIKYRIQNLSSNDITITKNMLEEFNKIREKVLSIDLPIGYYVENKKIKGLIIYYYQQALSLKDFLCQYTFSDLLQYYSREDNPYQNIIKMYLDIISLIEQLLDEHVYYWDIHSGNFIFYQNQVKLIDFEPTELSFAKDNRLFYERILYALKMLINHTNMKLGLYSYLEKDINSITKLKEEVKRLEKRL